MWVDDAECGWMMLRVGYTECEWMMLSVGG